MQRAARHVYVSGRVQGVAFRWHARTRAGTLAICGWIRNLPDGRVEAWVEGEPERVEAMLAWLRRGPPAALVEGLVASEVAPGGHAGFEVRG